MEEQHAPAETSEHDARVPPARLGSRDERREVTLRALAAGEEARCAYCGEPLPPVPSRGGRPTPYCPPEPERYGQWGAKTITCAMLDEHREIWTRVYGPDQPMTHLDVHALDERLSALLAVVDPVREEIAGLRAHATTELATALSARAAAEADRDQALEQARAATSDRDQAQAEATRAHEEAEAARTERTTAEQQASQALADRDEAIAERRAAHEEAEAARTDRQQALDQVSTAHQRIDDLQSALTTERATTVDRLDQLRREEEQARQNVRTTLSEEYEQRLRTQAEEFRERLEAAQSTADQRIAELTNQLTESTRTYASSLAPLHDEISTLKHDLEAQTTSATTARRQLDELSNDLARVLQHTTADDAVRKELQAVLARTDPATTDTSSLDGASE